ncbi:membrane fusion protein, cobalt-zinc-cadmium efflux system [Desulfotomaculum arcticum]|uniref:Membrane fusion protein, cobalt-zinc-cadmium efflux system n=1 Tax=Desulfotruncus arcticus DSM 17038 TaxID=1121424 RepID=A0A1I2X1V7_9FIRM|nr:efflux RND transporter periplasmic adaptor subunit [Desulfotruncus arcticus]SFH06656.1 membrane fusion protein, cobalt-zinc-cadmium efflux system [Desulfotomaculum arcticum] [Desulfotruncus arcticus DSM 17038]
MAIINRKVFIVLAFWLIILSALTGCGGKDNQTADGEKTVIPVQTAAAAKGMLADTTVVSGKLEALESSDVVAGGQGGKVYSVNVSLGDKVSKGQVLVTLENETQAAAVRQAEGGVAQNEAALEVAKINYEQAKANYERGKELYDSDVIAQAGQTGFETTYEIPYKQAKVDLEQTKPAALAAARAALASAQQQYDNCFIKSPINGVVTAVNVDPGELASPSASPVVSLVNLSKVVVKSTVTENQINTIKQGQKVPVLVSAVSADPITGVISNIALAADPASKAYPIKVQINNSDLKLKPGMFAEVQLTGEKQKTLVVPREAVVKIDGRDNVWVINDNKAASRPVTVGSSDGKSIEIKDGLKEGEQVVISGQDSLQDNAEVEVKK